MAAVADTDAADTGAAPAADTGAADTDDPMADTGAANIGEARVETLTVLRAVDPVASARAHAAALSRIVTTAAVASSGAANKARMFAFEEADKAVAGWALNSKYPEGAAHAQGMSDTRSLLARTGWPSVKRAVHAQGHNCPLCNQKFRCSAAQLAGHLAACVGPGNEISTGATCLPPPFT
ncbi:hypothetical protein T492DRAFT_12895 [Pavlovales sp. CCMP2436]|nr:hypothetical protein T492DRAFT_12895 [Pavlovales sp. CCMP2436]